MLCLIMGAERASEFSGSSIRILWYLGAQGVSLKSLSGENSSLHIHALTGILHVLLHVQNPVRASYADLNALSLMLIIRAPPLP